MKQNKNSLIFMGGSGLDRTDDLQKFCRSGLDRIQFYWNRTGLGLKNFTVRSSLLDMWKWLRMKETSKTQTEFTKTLPCNQTS